MVILVFIEGRVERNEWITVQSMLQRQKEKSLNIKLCKQWPTMSISNPLLVYTFPKIHRLIIPSLFGRRHTHTQEECYIASLTNENGLKYVLFDALVCCKVKVQRP